MADSLSLRSSDGTCSSQGEERERAKIVQKIVEIKEALRAANEKNEAAVEKFLNFTKQSETSRGLGNDNNPQLVRIRNNFERQNKKYLSDVDASRKMLHGFEERLRQIDNGELELSPVKNSVLPQGFNFRKAKGVTEHVVNAQMELAHRIKSAMSADNVNLSNDGKQGEKFGQSTFFTGRRSADGENFPSDERKAVPEARQSSTLPPSLNLSSTEPYLAYREENDPISRPGSSIDETNPFLSASNSICMPMYYGQNDKSNLDFIHAMQDSLGTLVLQVQDLDKRYIRLQDEVMKEIRFYAEALEQERYNITNLEKALNDTIELHQAEFEALKEQNVLATRVDYQHNDRFKNLEEVLESMQNRMERMDNAVSEVKYQKLTSSFWQRAALTFGNVFVELLKLALFMVAGLLDLLRPMTGSRNRSFFAFCFAIVLVVFLSNFSISSIFSFFTTPKPTNSSS